MSEEKPRLARLTAILTQLQSKKIVTSTALAAKHGVSIRTIYRDIRTLEQSGVPIVTEEGKGYSLLEGYQIPPVMFTEEEAQALITAEQLIQQNKDQSLVEYYQQAVSKIKAVLKSSQKEASAFLEERIQIRDNPTQEKTSASLIEMQAAIAKNQVIDLHYVSLNQESTQRKIEPFAVYTTKNNWVLIAYCRLKKDFRAFRLDCIKSYSIMNEHFTPHEMTLEQYLENCRKKWSPTPDIPLTPTPLTFGVNQNNQPMKNVTIAPFHMIGLAIKTTNTNGQAGDDIAQLWQKFMTENTLEAIPNKVDNTVYSLYTNYEGDHTQPYTAILGCKVTSLENVPTGMHSQSFEGGEYIQLSAKGNLMEGLIVNQWKEIWNLDLKRKFTADFEVFGEKAQDPTNAEVDFLIAIES